jgi:hypothetical protein
VLFGGDHGKPSTQAVDGGVGVHPGGVQVEFLALHQPRLDAQLHDALEEAIEDLDAVAASDLGQAAVVVQRLVKVVPRYQRWARFRWAISIRRRSDVIFSKKAISWSLKKTSGSMERRPSSS